ncbi:MAG: hypothetical protein ABR541_02275 [Candidatus Dormibacteria bacterium]
MGVGLGVRVGGAEGVGAAELEPAGEDAPAPGVAPPGVLGALLVPGVDVGGSGAVGQFASAGSNGVAGARVGGAAAEAGGDALGDAAGLPAALPDGVGLALGGALVTYGVKVGHGGGGATAEPCEPPVTSSEMVTARAPMRTVATKVTAPHSRRNSALTPAPPWD